MGKDPLVPAVGATFALENDIRELLVEENGAEIACDHACVVNLVREVVGLLIGPNLAAELAEAIAGRQAHLLLALRRATILHEAAAGARHILLRPLLDLAVPFVDGLRRAIDSLILFLHSLACSEFRIRLK